MRAILSAIHTRSLVFRYPELIRPKARHLENESDPLIPFLIKANNNQLTTEEHKSYLQVLRKRKQILNSTFTFSPEAVAKIERINTWLDKKYRSVIQQTDMLCAFAQVQIQKNAFINDYETVFTFVR